MMLTLLGVPTIAGSTINLSLLCFSSDQMSSGSMTTLLPRENQCIGYNSYDIPGSQAQAWNISSLHMTMEGCRENGLRWRETFSEVFYRQASAIGYLVLTDTWRDCCHCRVLRVWFLLSKATEHSHRGVVPLWLCRESYILASDHSLLYSCVQTLALAPTPLSSSPTYL